MGFPANNRGMTPLVCFPTDVKRGEARGRRSVKKTTEHDVQSQWAQVCD